MAKLTQTVALLALLLVVVSCATACKTTITTVEIDEPNPGRGSQSERCRRQMQGQDFSHCERFLSQSRRSILAMRGVDDQARGEREHLQQCCQQFRQLDEDCQCEAFQSMVREQRQRQRGQQEFEQRARQIHSQCDLPQQCQFRPFWY